MENLKTAVWIAHSLFERGKASGSSANMSFKEKDRIYITGSGTCFGTLKEEDFSVLSLDGEWISGPKPSKEFPLHQMMYEKSEEIQAVIHTHSFYATLWSCAVHENRTDCIPQYTPYLKMKLGTVGLVPYGKPGSEELFSAFRQCVSGSDGFSLENHGPIVGGKNLLDAFYCLEELEESARMAWEIESKQGPLSFRKI
ncbi:MAG: class II aldolase/adducin family protein [Anaerotignum sp.]